jgi:diguanylate cyclase (GGDEF)-like protein
VQDFILRSVNFRGEFTPRRRGNGLHMQRTTIAAGETRLRHLAMHDPICGPSNRIYFGESVIAEVRRGGRSAAVFYIDLDHFKDVNDALGHHIGDELILKVTQRLSRVMRGDDLVARLGGDKFAIITTCASEIVSAVCAPYFISGHNIIIGASIGIAVIDRRARRRRYSALHRAAFVPAGPGRAFDAGLPLRAAWSRGRHQRPDRCP